MRDGSGTSGTPLAKKLGLKSGRSALLLDLPPDLRPVFDGAGFAALIEGTLSNPVPEGLWDYVHIFAAWRAGLDPALAALRHGLAPDGMIWVSWPKQAARRPGDLTEHGIRDAALPLGLVDVKVCAVDAVWSGLRLVIRKALR
jgi:hypothetical protein